MPTPDETIPPRQMGSDEIEEMDDLDVEVTLLSALSSGDMGEPIVELDLKSLSPAEKRTVLALMRHRFGIGHRTTASSDGGTANPDTEAVSAP
jgi:hypothetical protein